VAEQVAAALDGTGCELTFVEGMPGRPSLAAVLPGAKSKPTLVLNGHMDTVPIDDETRWSTDPFGGEIRDGCVWGRGSVDMKAGLTAQIATAHVISQVPSDSRGTLILHFAAGEERGEPGTLSLIEKGFVGDWGITTEPTSLDVGIAQRGVAWYRIILRGRSSHASCPHVGTNPLDHLGGVLTSLASYGREIEHKSHALFPSPTLSATMVRAGVEQNMLPDQLELIVDRRLLPGETSEHVLDELRSAIGSSSNERDGLSLTVEPYLRPFEPSEIEADSGLVRVVAQAVEDVTGERPSLIGTPYGSDVRNLINDAGMEAVTFGPGDVELCHCVDERVAIVEVRNAAVVLTKVACDLLF
jgi:succinyl-diaminopimelate desuccinylase